MVLEPMENNNDLMDNKYFEYVSCPICGIDKVNLFFSVPYGKLKQKKSLDYSILGINKNTVLTVSKCKNCKFVFTNPRIRKGYEEIVYNESKQNLYKNNKTFIIGTTENINFSRERKLQYLTTLLKMLNLVSTDNSMKIFDFGCGFGHTLSLAKEFGIEGMGIEIDNFRLGYCKKLGLNVYTPDEFKAEFLNLKFDLIICQSVIEHITDLDEFLLIIDSISKENTVLFTNGVTPKLIKIENKKGKFVKAHFLEHVNYFYGTTLDFFMRKVAFYPFKKKIVLVNGRKIFIPLTLIRILRRDKGFFERIYIKRRESYEGI